MTSTSRWRAACLATIENRNETKQPKRRAILRSARHPRRATAVARWPWRDLMAAWSETSFAMVERRDNPESAKAEFAWRCDDDEPGITPKLSFDPAQDIAAPYIAKGVRPKIAVLRGSGKLANASRGAPDSV